MKERKQAIRTKRDAKTDAKEIQKHTDELQEGLAKIEHHRAVWESSLEARTMALGIQMCSEESRRDNPACKHFLQPHGRDVNETAVTTASEGTSEFLTLPTLVSLSKPKNSKFLEKRAGKQRLTYEAQDLHKKHWHGKIPKVGCVMPIPTMNDTSKEAWLRFAVTNAVNAFRAENYEGPKQLVIVHHNKDKMAARIADRLADGFYVKIVHAHMDVPSTMAMRYAAWSADKDVDVIARWDVNAYHHPDRLSMQVRALGLSGRPVSVSMCGATFEKDGKKSLSCEESGLESSMVGIRSWMDGHWHPYVESHSSPLTKVSDLVILNMPELTRAPEPTRITQSSGQ